MSTISQRFVERLPAQCPTCGADVQGWACETFTDDMQIGRGWMFDPCECPFDPNDYLGSTAGTGQS